MTRLLEAVQTFGLEADIAPSGRLVKIRGERCAVFVAEDAWGSQYYTWCDGAWARTVELYASAQEAIQAGLRRAVNSAKEEPWEQKPRIK